jgi:hypothetical protein
VDDWEIAPEGNVGEDRCTETFCKIELEGNGDG